MILPNNDMLASSLLDEEAITKTDKTNWFVIVCLPVDIILVLVT